ncbi:hypothetical protein Syun_004754 [Stephania yunnanensis]|uniref:RRM domain-containing protein n=1 Tax=Stephania yunnanensis TaxID=152371 RepID=A0AAP0Q147_9MAGN
MDDLAAYYPPPPPPHNPTYAYYPPPPPPAEAPPPPLPARRRHRSSALPPSALPAAPAPSSILRVFPILPRRGTNSLHRRAARRRQGPRNLQSLPRVPRVPILAAPERYRLLTGAELREGLGRKKKKKRGNILMMGLFTTEGLMFDLEKQSILYINLAKSNSRSKRLRSDDGRSGPSDKKVKGSFSRGSADTGDVDSHGFDTGATSGSETNKMSSVGPYVPQNNTPCPTLFVANLGQTCTEQELNQVFSRCPGFLKLKMQNKNGAPVSFVDFQDVACSTAALNSLQGTVLYSSNGEGMRLEFAKSRMGMRRKPS